MTLNKSCIAVKAAFLQQTDGGQLHAGKLTVEMAECQSNSVTVAWCVKRGE